MNLNLTLEALKFANVSTFSRTFGTKKTGAQNGGSLTTEEFNIANALPFDKMRPIELTENSTTGYVEYNANLVINSAGITLTLNSGTYKGVKIEVYAQTSGNVVHDSNVTDALLAGERAIYEWNGTTWDYVGGSSLGQINYTTMCTTALSTAKAVTIKGFTLKDGTTIDVYFVNGHYAALSTDPFTININGLGAKKIYICKDGVQALMTSHQLTRSESGDSAVHSWFIQPNTTLKLMYISTLDSDNGGFVVIGNPIVLSGTDYTIYADGFNSKPIETDNVLINSNAWTTKTWTPTKTIPKGKYLVTCFSEYTNNTNSSIICIDSIQALNGVSITPIILGLKIYCNINYGQTSGISCIVEFTSDVTSLTCLCACQNSFNNLKMTFTRLI